MDKQILLPDSLPSYTDAIRARPRFPRRRFRLVGLLVLLFFGYHAYQISSHTARDPQLLDVQRLEEQYASCAVLQHVPESPSGTRDVNKRWTTKTKPVVIRNATVWTGEAKEGTSVEEERRGVGYEWVRKDVLLEKGLIAKIADNIGDAELPEGCEVYDAQGYQLTAGIVDMHSHASLGGFADLGDDTNELSGDITPYVKSLDAINPLAPELQWIKSGGVTTSLFLPGSGNNIGGEAFVLKLATGNWSGRNEISQEDMFADPDKNWRYMKNACGENPKSVYGKIGRGPFSRLGEGWEFRHAFQEARDYVNKQDAWCAGAQKVGARNMKEYLPFDLKWETMGAVLRGQVRVNTHCYTVPDLEAYVRLTNEYQFRVYAFHHAHQTYLVPEILKRAYGGTPAIALFADSMYYKVESYIASERAGLIAYNEGITPVYVSDNPVLNSQHVLFEAAKAYGAGLPYHAALAGVTSAPAELLGFGERLGKVKEGFDADIVVWDSDPLSVGATPRQVWVDGAAQFENPVLLKKPVQNATVPDISLAKELEFNNMNDVVFTGIRHNFLDDDSQTSTIDGPFNLVISNGSIACLGVCEQEVKAASSKKISSIALTNGYLGTPFTAFGSSLGLLEIDAEKATQDGGFNAGSFARAVDGLALGGKQLQAAYRHGVTKAISAPSRGSIDAQGVSVGFYTGSDVPVGDAVWQEDVAAHYTVDLRARNEQNPSISAAVGNLRKKLLKAKAAKGKKAKDIDPFSEEYYLSKVVHEGMPLVLSVHSADTIAAIIRVKSDVETYSAKEETESSKKKPKSTPLNIILLGAAEAHLVAPTIAAANISVIVAPLLPYAQSWTQRRSLSGAPLTNGTAIDALLAAGVLTGIGVNEIYETRDLGLMAGWAYKNGEGRVGEKEAWGLVGKNVAKMLGVGMAEEWGVWEGNPLEIGGRVRGLGGAAGVRVWV